MTSQGGSLFVELSQHLRNGSRYPALVSFLVFIAPGFPAGCPLAAWKPWRPEKKTLEVNALLAWDYNSQKTVELLFVNDLPHSVLLLLPSCLKLR